jgi:hypothetical protein
MDCLFVAGAVIDFLVVLAVVLLVLEYLYPDEDGPRSHY